MNLLLEGRLPVIPAQSPANSDISPAPGPDGAIDNRRLDDNRRGSDGHDLWRALDRESGDVAVDLAPGDVAHSPVQCRRRDRGRLTPAARCPSGGSAKLQASEQAHDLGGHRQGTGPAPRKLGGACPLSEG
jgi:hypothetical protein